MAAIKMVLVVGNTFPVKEELKRLGGAWDARNRGWLVPEQHSAEANHIVAEAGQKTARRTATTAPSRSTRTSRPRSFRPCGYPGCNPGYCDECDGAGMGGCR